MCSDQISGELVRANASVGFHQLVENTLARGPRIRGFVRQPAETARIQEISRDAMMSVALFQEINSVRFSIGWISCVKDGTFFMRCGEKVPALTLSAWSYQVVTFSIPGAYDGGTITTQAPPSARTGSSSPTFINALTGRQILRHTSHRCLQNYPGRG